MGNQTSTKKVNFEDVQCVVKDRSPTTLLINTLNNNNQDCLITRTVPISNETAIVNRLIGNSAARIVVYGRNSNDDTAYKKYDQLVGLGFANVYLYTGGMFEWLLLQDIYGKSEFPTTANELDLLRYRPRSSLSGSQLLMDGAA